MKRRSTRAVGGASSSFVATASKRTLSEGWFVECARERGLSGWETHEPNLGIPTRPDFLLRVPAASTGAVCEVKEFRTSGLQRRLERPHNRVLTLSDDEVYGSIRRQVREAAKQLKPLASRRDLALVVVLANPRAVPMGLDVDHVEATLYGNPTFGGPVNPQTGAVESFGRLPGRDGKLTNDHRYISAVVVLFRRTHEQDHRDAWWGEHGPDIRARARDRREHAAAVLEASTRIPPGPPGHYHRVQVMHTRSAVAGEAVGLPTGSSMLPMTSTTSPAGTGSTSEFAEVWGASRRLSGRRRDAAVCPV